MRRKNLISLILACVMLVCMIPVHAAQSDADGLVPASAARYVLRVARGLEEAPQDENAFLAIDLDGDGAVTEADFTGMLRLSVGLDAFDLPSRSMPVAEETEEDTAADTGSADKSSGGSSYSDSDYWDKPWGPVPGALPKGETGKYAVNTNTGKFHKPECYMVNSILFENRDDLYCTFEEAIAKGYSPCQKCLKNGGK